MRRRGFIKAAAGVVAAPSLLESRESEPTVTKEMQMPETTMVNPVTGEVVFHGDAETVRISYERLHT